jgi:hypothetical protein
MAASWPVIPNGPLDKEPVAILLAGLAGVVDASIAAATALDWVDLTSQQAGSVIAFVTVLTGLIGSVLRAQVWSPTSHVTDVVATRSNP